eukprot:SAG11_NODE_1262_length_5356_cov_12.287807_3_plen_277_part_00
MRPRPPPPPRTPALRHAREGGASAARPSQLGGWRSGGSAEAGVQLRRAAAGGSGRCASAYVSMRSRSRSNTEESHRSCNVSGAVRHSPELNTEESHTCASTAVSTRSSLRSNPPIRRSKLACAPHADCGHISTEEKAGEGRRRQEEQEEAAGAGGAGGGGGGGGGGEGGEGGGEGGGGGVPSEPHRAQRSGCCASSAAAAPPRTAPAARATAAAAGARPPTGAPLPLPLLPLLAAAACRRARHRGLCRRGIILIYPRRTRATVVFPIGKRRLSQEE